MNPTFTLPIYPPFTPDKPPEGYFNARAELERAPNFWDLVLSEVEKVGVVGERRAIEAIFTYTATRLVENLQKPAPHALVNANSSAGKDFITKRTVRIWPKESYEEVLGVSPASLKYWHAGEEEFTWTGKTLRISDISFDLMKSEVFKTFLSDDEKSVVVNASAKTGRKAVEELIVKGRPVVIATTAEGNPGNEIMNRFDIINLDESQAQTLAILERKAKEAAGKINENTAYHPLISSALADLRRVSVVIPYAENIIPHLPTDDTRYRRFGPRLFNLIKGVAAFHQYQRERDNEGRVIAEQADYEIARRVIQAVQTGQYSRLTRGKKRIYEALIEWHKKYGFEQGVQARKLRAFKPEAGNDKSFYNGLNALAELGLVSLEVEDSLAEDGARRGPKPTLYRAKNQHLQAVDLPEWAVLPYPPISKIEQSKLGGSLVETLQ